VSAGVISLFGEAVAFRNGVGATARGVCMVPEERGIFPNLSVWENLIMWTYGRPELKVKDVASISFDRFPVLGRRWKQQAGTLSSGEQQMLALSRALSVRPRVLLVDELSMGLAPMIVEELYGVVKELAGAGLSVVVVEQYAEAALDIADKGAVLVNGRIVGLGSADEIRASLAHHYLAS
jgi:branched-chain amino acid transport system ATP-binding protein